MPGFSRSREPPDEEYYKIMGKETILSHYYYDAS